MKSKRRKSTFFLFLILMLGIIFIGIIFSIRKAGDENPNQADLGSVTSTSIWIAFQQSTPFAYTTPLPDAVQNSLDGVYALIDQSQPQWWSCRRCADYRPVGGIWRLQFDKGVMRIFYEVTGWRSIASYTVSEDRLYIFNDPYCPQDVGEYKWKVEGERLEIEIVQDACAYELRAKNLSRPSWIFCAASVAAIDINVSELGHLGCAENLAIPTPDVLQSDPSIQVTVYAGDSRFFDTPPDVIAIANTVDRQPPTGIDIGFDGNTIPYGVHRILWWNGNWIEASTDLPFTAMGVQFFGEEQIGWARVLFDEVEVWRGNTSALSSKNGRHGGYIEVSGFSPGKHTIRAESLGFDYRPVTVVSFGFSNGLGVKNDTP